MCLKLFLGSMDSGARRNLDGQGIQMVGPVDLNPRELNTDMWDTESMCTRRAEGAQRK